MIWAKCWTRGRFARKKGGKVYYSGGKCGLSGALREKIGKRPPVRFEWGSSTSEAVAHRGGWGGTDHCSPPFSKSKKDGGRCSQSWKNFIRGVLARARGGKKCKGVKTLVQRGCGKRCLLKKYIGQGEGGGGLLH